MGLRNQFADKFLEFEKRGVSDEELNRYVTGTNNWTLDGDVENGYGLVGQSLSRLNEIKPTAEIIKSIMSGTISILNNGSNLTK